MRHSILFSIPAGRAAREISSIEAILSEANTSLRGFPPAFGPFLAFAILLFRVQHREKIF
jgi:hypothetical protein